MSDDEFLKLLSEYLEPAGYPAPGMATVDIVWERNNPRFGSLHIWMDHRITEQEVEQVILEIPPRVEAKRHPLSP